MRVYACLMSENESMRLVKIVSDFKAAKKWKHDMVKTIIKGEQLYARYLLTLQKPIRINKDGTCRRKPLHPWFRYKNEHGLNKFSERHSPYFVEYEVDT